MNYIQVKTNQENSFEIIWIPQISLDQKGNNFELAYRQAKKIDKTVDIMNKYNDIYGTKPK